MSKFICLYAALTCIFSAQSWASPPVDPALAKIDDKCVLKGAAAPGRHVFLIKQWHLDGSVDTRTKPPKEASQARNQAAIFGQLDKWVQGGKLAAVIAEGCSGEIAAGSALKFNGWTVADLKAVSGRGDFAAVITSVPMKIEARHGDRIKTLCGDDPALIKENLRAFSDTRGVIGFMTRLDQYTHDTMRAKPYLDGVIKLYKMPEDTRVEQALWKLRSELKVAIKKILESIDKRNESVVAAVKAAPQGEIAVVFGGAHAPGIKAGLEKSNIACTVLVPDGYSDEEKEMIEKLKTFAGKKE